MTCMDAVDQAGYGIESLIRIQGAHLDVWIIICMLNLKKNEVCCDCGKSTAEKIEANLQHKKIFKFDNDQPMPTRKSE